MIDLHPSQALHMTCILLSCYDTIDYGFISIKKEYGFIVQHGQLLHSPIDEM